MNTWTGTGALARALCLLAALAVAPLAGASVMSTPAGVAGAPAGPFDPDQPGGDTWTIGAPGNPIPIIADPNAPPWEKNLTGIRDLAPGERIQIHEHLLLGPIRHPVWHKYVDWHERLPPGWEWVGPGAGAMDPVIMFPGAGPVPGLQVMISPDGLDIWFDFDPILPGTEIAIWKEIECVAANGCNEGVLAIVEFPTIAPEPATLGALGLGLVGLAALGRRRTPREARA